jgi:hypothetical protein
MAIPNNLTLFIASFQAIKWECGHTRQQIAHGVRYNFATDVNEFLTMLKTNVELSFPKDDGWEITYSYDDIHKEWINYEA